MSHFLSSVKLQERAYLSDSRLEVQPSFSDIFDDKNEDYIKI